MLKKFFHIKIGGIDLSVYILLALVAVIGFWPVTTGFFAVKNDDIIYFLPYRYNIVESIRNGHFPIWSPYIYMGFPIIGDIQSGAWNPIVWIFSLFGRYTLTSLHIELLLYIYIAGIGMYKLIQELKYQKLVCFVIAISYMFCGYIMDTGQILCWVSSACLLPYLCIYFYRILHFPTLVNAVKLALVNVAMIVIAGYPFCFIASVYFMLIGVCVFTIQCIREKKSEHIKRVYFSLFISIVLFSLLITAPLLSYTDLFPFYERGSGVSLKSACRNSFTFFSSLSIAFPFATTRHHTMFLNSDMTGRNIYMGLLLIPFVIAGIKKKKTTGWILVLSFTIIAYLLSLGEQLPFRALAYHYLPLMNTFRHPTNYRIFVIIGLLIMAARGIQVFINDKTIQKKRYLTVWYIAIFLLLLVFTLYFLPETSAFDRNSIKFSSASAKALLNKTGFKEAILIGFLLQAPFLIAAIIAMRKNKIKWVLLVAIANIVCISQLQLFVTFVSKDPVAAYNKIILKQPKGYPTPDLNKRIAFPDKYTTFLYEYKSPVEYFFNKQIAINTFLNNPTILSSYKQFLSDTSLLFSLSKHPLIYFTDSSHNTNSSIKITSFQPNAIQLSVTTDTLLQLVILQNNYPYWKGQLDNIPISIQTVNYTFMGISVPKGKHEIILACKPSWFNIGLLISGLGLFISIFILLSAHYKRNEKYKT